MKKNSFVLAICLFLTSVTLYSQPKLEFDCGNIYDWGKVSTKGSPLKCSISIYNTGNEVLNISKVKPACGCTKGKLSKSDILPGDSAKIDFSLSVGAKSGLISIKWTMMLTISHIGLK